MYLIIMPHTYYYLNHPKPQTQNPYNILDYNMQRFWASSSGFPPPLHEVEKWPLQLSRFVPRPCLKRTWS